MKNEETKASKVDLLSMEKALNTLARRLSSSAPKSYGGILINLTDSDEKVSVESSERESVVSRGATSELPIVTISGPSGVLKSIMDGKKEASRAFASGGIQVSGDVGHLEALLKDLGLLNCG
jgi:putative sterol carrier protein